MSDISDRAETLFICSCEDSFAPDIGAIGAALDQNGQAKANIVACRHLCGPERDRVARAAQNSDMITIACRQEEPGFRAILEDLQFTGTSRFVDIRDSAGWSDDAAQAQPKMAALIAAARIPAPTMPFVTMESQGVALIYGHDATAIEVGERLADSLDITVVLRAPGEVAPPARTAFPIARGLIRSATGYLGNFDLVVDDFALAKPSSREKLVFGAVREGARSRCDLVIDVSGGPPLFSADSLRDGYLRADPGSQIQLSRLIEKASQLIGTFDKPKYVDFRGDLCAHSRSRITGCTRCLSMCPTGAISPAGDTVAIDPFICAGCGSCSSVCPTGAASYALPGTNTLLERMRALLRTYGLAGGKDPVLLLHSGSHGGDVITALARSGPGLPSDVIPFMINEVTQLGLAELAAAFAFGAAACVILAPGRPKHDIESLRSLQATMRALLPALGHDLSGISILETDDPDVLTHELAAIKARASINKPAYFKPSGGRRDLALLALREWRAAAHVQPDCVPLPPGAGFGGLDIRVDGCTLCLSCVSACPSSALTANPERPELRFQEDLCVQCGLCQATCPEKVITLKPQLNFLAINAPPISVKQEEPYACDRCSKPFGTRSTIERIKSKLAGKHWMYSGANSDRLALIGYCDDCRIEVAALAGFDPYGAVERPPVRTTEDYLRAENKTSENK